MNGAPDRVLSLAVAPRADRMLVGRNVVDVWFLASGKPPHALVDLTGPFLTVAWVRGSEPRALAGAAGGWIGLMDLAGEAEPLRSHADSVTSVSVSADGRLAASASLDGTLRLWDPSTKDVLDEVELVTGDHANSIALTPAGDLLLVGTEMGLVRAYKVETTSPRPERR